MRFEQLALLRCPRTQQRLELVDPQYEGSRIRSARLVAMDGANYYEIRDFIPRFVPESNYADSFGLQWNRFRRTQLDSYSGHSISADRFWNATAWAPRDLSGKRVLDVGCGSGRFSEIVLEAGAHVVALDYSSAVDACYSNLQQYDNLTVIQGDIYSLPLKPAMFDYVYSLGVLQHTPNVKAAFAALPSMLAPGGRICVDFYEKSWKSKLLPKYWLRPVTKRLSKTRLFSMLERVVPLMLPVSRAVGKMPFFGYQLKRLVPVANYVGSLPLTDKQHLEWSLLDTFDWLSPEFDNPQTSASVRSFFEAAGIEEIEVEKAGHLVGRGRRSQ